MRTLLACLLLLITTSPALAQTVADRLDKLERRLRDLEWENTQLKKAREQEAKEADKRQRDLERENAALKKQVAANTASIKQTAVGGEALSQLAKFNSETLKGVASRLKEVDAAIKTYGAWRGTIDDVKTLRDDWNRLKGFVTRVRDDIKAELTGVDKRLGTAEREDGKNDQTDAAQEKAIKALQKETNDLKLTVDRWHKEDLKRLEEQDKMFGDTLRDHWKKIEAHQKRLDELKKTDDESEKKLAESLIGNEKFMKSLVTQLGKAGLTKTLATELPKQRELLAGIATSSDFQRSMAYNLTKGHVRTFAEALIKYDAFQKALEYYLVKSDRYVKAMAVQQAKTGLLATQMVGDDRFKKNLATELGKEAYLRYLIEGLGRSSKFASTLSESSTFTTKFAKSSRFTRALTENSDFVNRMRSQLAR